jgi:hypothetical protein
VNVNNIYIADFDCQEALDFVKRTIVIAGASSAQASWSKPATLHSSSQPFSQPRLFGFGHAETAQIDQRFGFKQLFGRHR